MRLDEDKIAKLTFGLWLKCTKPEIVDMGKTVVWRGRGWNEVGRYHPWYRIVICRFLGELGDPLIETDCDNQTMAAWMREHEADLLEVLIEYCKAVWDMVDDRLVSPSMFDRDEDDIEWDEDIEEWEREQEEAQNNAADAVNKAARCEQKYGFDYT